MNTLEGRRAVVTGGCKGAGAAVVDGGTVATI
ncbi:MAG: hypothetical protein QOK02_2602 [Mycobacterium sp.]|jgi:NAD(P)-dependent dehydrogenase (short-subunit alcohol dehydrogenase family)|nr:hypothetical protein [Mycobacterium sp.]